MKMRVVVFLFMSIGITTSQLFAQSFYGSVVGTITDTSGAVVPGAKVMLTNKGTADTRTVQSDATGHYEFLSLVPGAYRLDVEATSFKHLSRDELTQLRKKRSPSALLKTAPPIQ